AMTSRGHSGLAEVVLGSVAQRIMRGAQKPVLMYHPLGKRPAADSSVRLTRVILPLDGSTLTEAIAADAARFAQWVGADLELVTALGDVSGANVGEPSGGEMVSLESGYVRAKGSELGKQYGVEINWDVLHGDPTEAIIGHVGNRRDVILAMTTRRQDALEATFLGSITAGCLRKAGVPVLMRLP
ncbi:MAG TPA: universal stress protein, partial [Castellaniella sp.]|nr:universal stress protein [Castellaniella sp.]